jgi:Escherichia/Staphylococcus phage prohead protease
MHLRSTLEPPLAIDATNRTVTAVISTPAPDRAGDVVVPAGLANAEEFLLNPVVLWAHQRAMPPIGTCIALDVQPRRVVAVTKFAAGVPLADDVFRLYEQGVLRGWSVGLLPRRATPRPGRRGTRIDEWDLLEYSAVPVPENPEALTLAVEKGLVTDSRLKRFIARLTADALSELVA